ncbi:MAG: murein biosynthesis integral membrane protein MurJ [Patescibacteria group bacterium]
MVRRLLNFLNKEILGLHQAAFLLGFFALSSQVLALVRDRLLAHNFGAGIELDIYYAAFRVPDFIFITIGSLVSVSVIVPFLVERIKEEKEEARYFIRQIFTFFFAVIILVSLAVFLFAPHILSFVFPGFYGEDFQLLVVLTRVMLLSPILLGVSNLFGSISQTHQRFFLYALSPVMYNLGIITGILFLTPNLGVLGVALGVILGAFLHMFIHVPFIIQKGFLPGFSLKPDISLFKSVAKLSIPRTLTLGVTNLLILALLSVASLMAEGSITVFNFSFNLQSVVLSTIGVSYSLAVFPTITKLFSQGKIEQYWRYVITSAQHIIFWSIPATVIFIVLRAQIVRVVLGTGQFDWSATQLTAAALALFSISVVFQGLVLLFIRSYYAMGKTALPLFINLFSGACAVASAFILTYFFKNADLFRYFMESLLRVEDLYGTEVLMLPLAFSVGMTVNGILFWLLLERRCKGFSYPILVTFSQIFASSIIAGAGAYVTLAIYSIFFELNTLFTVLMQGVCAGVVALLMNILVLLLLDNKEIKVVMETLKHRFWKAKLPISETK